MIVPTETSRFETLRREAKRLLKNLRDGDRAATVRIAPYWPRNGVADEVCLAQIQLVVARERGYRSWAHLKTSLLTIKEIDMPEQNNANTLSRRLGVYTDEEAASLLALPKEE